MKPIEFNITREITPGTAITIKLTQDEISQIFRAKDDAYMLEDAFTQIGKLIASITKNGSDPTAFTQKYHVPVSAIKDNESFAQSCVEAFKYEIDGDGNHDAAWARVIHERLTAVNY